MPALPSAEIRSIVFDLDGTLYVCDRFAAEIQKTGAAYVAALKGISQSEAMRLIAATRHRFAEENGATQTLSAVCLELGGSVRELHDFFVRTLRPEAYLVRDERVIRLLERLAERFSLYVYTNNNRILTTRIMNYLGLDHVVCDIFTIDETWQGKPDREMVGLVLERIAGAPGAVLFVGDRYDVDLRVPEQFGCPVYLSQTLEQLLRLEELLVTAPCADTSTAPAYPPVVPS